MTDGKALTKLATGFREAGIHLQKGTRRTNELATRTGCDLIQFHNAIRTFQELSRNAGIPLPK